MNELQTIRQSNPKDRYRKSPQNTFSSIYEKVRNSQKKNGAKLKKIEQLISKNIKIPISNCIPNFHQEIVENNGFIISKRDNFLESYQIKR